jgi:hypothetical protein
MRMWVARASIRCQVAIRTAHSARAGMTAHASSPLRDEAGTNSDLFARCATKVDLRIATSATRQAATAIQKIVSATG